VGDELVLDIIFLSEVTVIIQIYSETWHEPDFNDVLLPVMIIYSAHLQRPILLPTKKEKENVHPHTYVYTLNLTTYVCN